MNVLSHGRPFFCIDSPLPLYNGAHDIRTLGIEEGAQYRYDPFAETWAEVLVRIRQEWSPDLLLCWMPELHPPPLGIEDSSIPTVALVSDWNIFYPVLALNLSRYDVVLCDLPGVEIFQSDYVNPRHLFPLYSHLSTLHRPHAVPKEFDVVFAGNLNPAAHPVRAQFLERLARLADRYRIFIGKMILGDDYARLFSGGRIVFNHSIRGELNLRVFETMACGSLALLEESNHEVRNWFQDGRELVLYNERNFEERIMYFLNNPTEAQTIAARGHARVTEFAAEHRFDALIDWAAAQPSSGRRFHELPESERRFQTILMYGFSPWPVFQQMEPRLVAHAIGRDGQDPRLWAAMGRHFLNVAHPGFTEPAQRERGIRAFLQAHRLAPHSGPYALNLATVYRAFGREDAEAHYLQAALNAETLDGASLIIGNHECRFWQRWQRALAAKRESLDLLKAEAHIRLAAILGRHKAIETVKAHLEQAEMLDPETVNGLRLHAEALWALGARMEAVDLLRRAVPRLSFDVSSRARLAELLRATGNATEAARADSDSAMLRIACPLEPFK